MAEDTDVRATKSSGIVSLDSHISNKMREKMMVNQSWSIEILIWSTLNVAIIRAVRK